MIEISKALIQIFKEVLNEFYLYFKDLISKTKI